MKYARWIFTVCTILSFVSLINAQTSSSDSSLKTSVISVWPRSIGRDKVLVVAGSEPYTHLFCMDNWYGSLSINFAYQRTRKKAAKELCDCMFGAVSVDPQTTPNVDGECAIRIQGCASQPHATNSLNAANFYLPVNFDSTVSFSPDLRNTFVNVDFFLGLDRLMQGLYFRTYAPLVHSRWSLGFKEVFNQKNPQGLYEAGYFTPARLLAQDLLPAFADYISGDAPAAAHGIDFGGFVPGFNPLTPDGIPPTFFNPLQVARIDPCGRIDNGLAEVRAELGWNFLQNDCYHLGANLQVALPSGSRRQPDYLLDTQIGSHHWEAGGGITAHSIIFQNDTESATLSWYLDANITHIFPRSEERTFDLKNNGPFSRYLLAQKFSTTTNEAVPRELQVSSNDPLFAIFDYELTPVANLTRQSVRVSALAHIDLVTWLNFRWCGLNADIGYNFWYRSCEQIRPDLCNPPAALDGKSWGLKGNAFVYGYVAANPPPPPPLLPRMPFPLGATQSTATIFQCIIDPTNGSIGIDNPEPATVGFNTANLTIFTNLTTPVLQSRQPILLKADDVDFGTTTRGMSHRVFGYISYSFLSSCWIPYIGFGGAVEFAQNKSPCPKVTTLTTVSSSSVCVDCAISQWSFWVNLGVAFN